MGGLSSSAGVNIGDTVGGGTKGSVLFLGTSGALEENNSALFWDDTNKFFGVNTAAAPLASMHVGGTILVNGTDSPVPASNGGLEISYTAGKAFLDAYNRSTLAYESIYIGAGINHTGSGGGKILIGSAIYPAYGPRVFLDGTSVPFIGGIYFTSTSSSTFSFDQGGIRWSSPNEMFTWTNIAAGRGGQAWKLAELGGGAGIRFYNSISNNIAFQVDSVATTGVNSAFKVGAAFYPPHPANAIQGSCSMSGGVGAPAAGDGIDGMYYFRSDGGVGTHIYFKTGGVWAGIV